MEEYVWDFKGVCACVWLYTNCAEKVCPKLPLIFK